MRPMPNDSLKHLEKHAKALLFPNISAKAVFALKVWENLKKNQNTQVGFEPTLHSEALPDYPSKSHP